MSVYFPTEASTVIEVVGRRTCAEADINKRVLCCDWLGNKSLMSLYVSGCLLVDSNVCRQSLGKAAAAALYTESVCQSVSRCQSVSGRVRLRVRFRESIVLECRRMRR